MTSHSNHSGVENFKWLHSKSEQNRTAMLIYNRVPRNHLQFLNTLNFRREIICVVKNFSLNEASWPANSEINKTLLPQRPDGIRANGLIIKQFGNFSLSELMPPGIWSSAVQRFRKCREPARHCPSGHFSSFLASQMDGTR